MAKSPLMKVSLYNFGETRVIILHHIQSKLAALKELIQQRAFHPYLAQNIQSAFIDEDKLLLLISIFDQLNLPDSETNTYITATTLIQLALDTHDHVQSNSIEADLKSQQLTVLAGDFYSGLYYKYLSGINDIALILELSRGVKEINEHKIMVYEQLQTNDISQVLSSLKKIEGALLEKIIAFFHKDIWTDFALNFLLVKRLLHEKNKYIVSGTSVGIAALKNSVFDNLDKSNGQPNFDHVEQKQLILVIDREINQAIQAMEIGRRKLPQLNKLLEDRIQAVLNQHQTMAKTFAEEG